MSSSFQRETLGHTVAFSNSKGGVGKTSIACNVAGIAAAAGHKTLLIDLDPQGNTGGDLGYRDLGLGDGGEHLVNTLMAKASHLQPVLTDVRPNLDVITGGDALEDLEAVVSSRDRRGEAADTLLAAALAPLAAEYALVVLDTPPGGSAILRLALTAARWIVIPTKSDRESIRGLHKLARRVAQVRAHNPDLQILGSVLFGIGASASAVRRDAEQDIRDVLGGVAPLFEISIRTAEAVAKEARDSGRLVHEIASAVEDAEPWWAALRDGRRPPRLPGTAPALADDYVLLTEEILTAIAAHDQEERTA